MTYSIIARDDRTGRIGVAVASKFFAVCHEAKVDVAFRAGDETLNDTRTVAAPDIQPGRQPAQRQLSFEILAHDRLAVDHGE
jgi:hypothetical protein